MTKKVSNKKVARVPKNEDGFDRLARMMKEGFDDLETNLRTEIKDVVLETEESLRTELRSVIKETEGTLRMEIREAEERLQYRISKVATDIYHHLDASVEPQIQNHERRIKRLEDAAKV